MLGPTYIEKQIEMNEKRNVVDDEKNSFFLFGKNAWLNKYNQTCFLNCFTDENIVKLKKKKLQIKCKEFEKIKMSSDLSQTTAFGMKTRAWAGRLILYFQCHCAFECYTIQIEQFTTVQCACDIWTTNDAENRSYHLRKEIQ